MGFLILPIQRLPRYRLLLEDLLKSSIDGYHKDYEALAAAVSRVCHVADYINSEKRKSDALHKLLDLQMIFKDKNNEVIHDIVSETRMLILEKIMFYKNGKKGQKRYIYLFNDSLIITKDKSMSKNGKQIVINFAMDMKTVNLEDAGETDLTITIQNFKEIKAKFANATDKQKFFEEFNAYKNNEKTNPLASSRPDFVPNSVAKKCSACKEEFSIFNVRHHCRMCGDCFCEKCCGNKVVLTKLEYNKKVKVCNDCVGKAQ